MLCDEGLQATGYWGRQAAGALLSAAGHILLLRRAAGVLEPGTWGIVGGAVPVETRTGRREPAWRAVQAEVIEELGELPPGWPTAAPRRSYRFTAPGFAYRTFIVRLPARARAWQPRLNWEHTAWRWCTRATRPRPLHPGVQWLLQHYDPWSRA
jgi:NUDIX domain